MIFNNKKGSQQMWWIIVAAVLAILVMIFLMIWFKGTGDDAFDSIKDKVTGLNDCDNDNVADMFDKCPCKAGDAGSEIDGCPRNTKKEELETKYKCTEEELKQCKE
ncbi:hypothetical protein HOE37_01355 [Candidatus Woesearchaeota archaeon]|jgi:hypothetical protein|nr:hypothetical protein [Candidatus Woesearchaeota archaeon]MBT4110483.1 hypothetical protein [Candidatus Woesearchaeota archaeon]MBT4335993.1 hypothetical protein [Candidatus Woesearchaeota archaeon]MBT4469028.1 hypothetical protein [Candidatus Woesearchaeota archaeon]MBT6744653.1 hypothetical protein [Candidatus Woesearchaeota archaeon]